MEAAAANESQGSRPQDFKPTSRQPKPTPEPNQIQTPPQDPSWTQNPSAAVSGERHQEKSSFSGSQVTGSPSNCKLFVCRLPLDITATKVAEIFSKFGETVEPGRRKKTPEMHNVILGLVVCSPTVDVAPE